MMFSTFLFIFGINLLLNYYNLAQAGSLPTGAQLHDSVVDAKNYDGRLNPSNTPILSPYPDDYGSSVVAENNRPVRKQRVKKKNRDKLIPPSKPRVFQLSNTSVMVNWEVPAKSGLPVFIFKLQYREVRTKESKDKVMWNTLPDEIPAFVTSYTVDGLKPGSMYRFRVAAVYTNNDNRVSKNSDKFHLIAPGTITSPKNPPIIISSNPVNSTSVEILWNYYNQSTMPIEGYFIHYRTTSSAGEYFKITVIGPTKRNYIISHLEPATSYEFKIQCFNSAGVSNFSEIRIFTTPVDPVTSTSTEITNIITNFNVLDKTDQKVENTTIYIIVVGSIGGFAVLVFTIFCILQCTTRCKQNSSETKKAAQQTNNGLINGSLLHRPPSEDYKNEPDTLSSYSDKVNLNNVVAAVNINHYPIFADEVKDERNFQTRTHLIDTFCEDTYASRTGSWTRKSRRKHYEHKTGVKLIASASSHNSLHRKYLDEVDIESGPLEHRKQRYKSEEHLRCSLNSRVHSKSSSFTKLDGTLEKKKKRMTDIPLPPQPPQINERLNISNHRSLSSSRLNGSLEKRKKSRTDFNNTIKNGKTTESQMNSCNGNLTHITNKPPPLLIMQTTC